MTSIGFPNKFDKNVSFLIATFLVPKSRKLLDWIIPEKLDWELVIPNADLSILRKYSNCVQNIGLESFAYPHVVEYLEENLNLIRWKSLSWNQCAVHLLEQNKNKICWIRICENRAAIDLIREITNNMTVHTHQINFRRLCQNINAIPLIDTFTCNMEKNLNEIDVNLLSRNPNGIPLVESFINKSKLNKSKVNWKYISENSNAVELLKQNIDRIDWREISSNTNIGSILQCLNEDDLMNVVTNELEWDHISWNEGAVDLLTHLYENTKFPVLQKINWRNLCCNKSFVPFLSKVTNNFTENLHFLSKQELSSKTHLFPVLEKITNNFTTNLDFIDWFFFSSNKHPKAIEFQIVKKVLLQIKRISLVDIGSIYHPTNLFLNLIIICTTIRCNKQLISFTICKSFVNHL
jgi:hypothetical protein